MDDDKVGRYVLWGIGGLVVLGLAGAGAHGRPSLGMGTLH